MESHQAPTLAKLVLISLTLVGLIFVVQNFFSIKKIECWNSAAPTSTTPCSSEVSQKLDQLQNKSLFFTDFDRTLGQFSEVKIKKKLPQTLIVNLKEKAENHFALVGSEIVMVSFEERDPDLTPPANQLVLALKNNQLEFTKLEYISQVFIVYWEKDQTEYRALIDSYDIATGVYRLKTILDHVDIKGELDLAVKEIDTRFKLPVLKTHFTNI